MPIPKKSKGRKTLLPPERLEARLLWSVGQDANGWTVVTPSADSRIIYVSSSIGNDTNSGLSTAAPIKTLTKAMSLVRSGDPDEILLKSGDVFNDSFKNWSASGRSAQEPMLISYYGAGARPLLDTGTASSGFNTLSTTGTVNYLDLIGIQFYENNRDPGSPSFSTTAAGGTTGFAFHALGGNILIEDCTFSYYRNNLDIEGTIGSTGNFVIRRCVSSYSWASNTNSQGMYCYSINNVSVQQCVFDHNGWNALITGAGQSGYNHDMYFASTCTAVDVENSVIADASYAGIMARAGGTIDNNLFMYDAVAISYGDADGSDSAIGGVSGSIIGNAVVGDKGLGTQNFGEGIDLGNITPGLGVIVANNIFTQDSQHTKAAIILTLSSNTKNPAQTDGLNDVTVENNIINGWYQGIWTDGRFVPGATGQYGLNDLQVLNNDVLNSTSHLIIHGTAFAPSAETWSGNRLYDTTIGQAAWVLMQGTNISVAQWFAQVDQTGSVLSSLPYADPNRSVSTYDSTLNGPGTWQDFIAQADQLSIYNYQPQYMAQAVLSYVDAGYSVDTSPPTAAAATTNLNSAAIGTTTYTFTVDYTDNFFLNTASLGSANLLATGPNGFSEPATFVSAAAPTTGLAGYQQTIATFSIAAPNGTWTAGQDGIYTITLLPNQVRDKTANAAISAVVGTFTVDFIPPVAIATTTDILDSSAGTSGYTFTVTYSDASGINPTTLNSSEVLVTGPNGYSQYAALTGQTAGSNAAGQPNITATYSISAPNGSWTPDANGAYTIATAGGVIADLLGNTLAPGVLGTFNVQLTGGTVSSGNTGSISGTVFNDANGNGIFDSREVPLIGVTVFIDLTGGGQLAPGDPTAITDANGNYTFTNLAPGQYTIIQVLPAGFLPTTPTSGSIPVALTSGQSTTGVNFADMISSTTVSGGGSGSTGGTTTGGTTTGGGATGGSTTGGTTSGGTAPGGTTGSGGAKKTGGTHKRGKLLQAIRNVLLAR